MCTTCGCGSAEVRIEGVDGHTHESHDPAYHAHATGFHRHADGSWHSHDHGPVRGVAGGAFGAVHAAHVSAERVVQIEQDILAKNDAHAASNRRRFADRGIFALNLVSSPGSGKTTLLVKTIDAWGPRTPVAVIEGDQQTSRDADRIRATGAAAIQINTGKGCHLDAQMIERALDALDPRDESLLMIENVGNLVCPAAFDLGEAHKVVILSVTEGDDKPLKYPDMFHAADLMIVSKVDLLPYVEFDVALAIENARRVRPGLPALTVSAKTGDGFGEWLTWLERGLAGVRDRARERRVPA